MKTIKLLLNTYIYFILIQKLITNYEWLYDFAKNLF